MLARAGEKSAGAGRAGALSSGLLPSFFCRRGRGSGRCREPKGIVDHQLISVGVSGGLAAVKVSGL